MVSTPGTTCEASVGRGRATSSLTVRDTSVEAIIAPALAVDTSGCRLGQGGGWYDRVLEYAPSSALVVAMVYPDEVYDAATRPLPREGHDRTVQVVATPTGCRRLGVGAEA